MLSYDDLKFLGQMSKRADKTVYTGTLADGTPDPATASGADDGKLLPGSYSAAHDELELAADEGNLGRYGKAVGMGAAGGAIAGIPIALIAHALLADKKNKDLKGFLRSALMGGGIGAAAGGLAGGGLRALSRSNPGFGGGVNSMLENAIMQDSVPGSANVGSNESNGALDDLLGYGQGKRITTDSPLMMNRVNSTEGVKGTWNDIIRATQQNVLGGL